MKKRYFLLAASIHLLSTGLLKAQNVDYTAWGALFHTQRFSNHWGASFDAQFRSANHAGYLRNILLRPSANYYFNKKTNVALGYAYVATHGRTAGDVKTFRPEHRIFEQFIYTHKVAGANQLTHRLRLEQRFLGGTATQNPVFSQRLRYFARGVIPLHKDSVFTKGTFLALQNEVFLNVQNKNKLNGKVFDQNRAYAAFGYRLNKMIDIEAGYLNQYAKQTETYLFNHVMQLAFYTRF